MVPCTVSIWARFRPSCLYHLILHTFYASSSAKAALIMMAHSILFFLHLTADLICTVNRTTEIISICAASAAAVKILQSSPCMSPSHIHCKA